jgi:hypothetical protein
MSEDQAPYNTKSLKKGTYVSRAAYAKLQGENKALKKDIYILCHEKHSFTADHALVLMHWRDKFRKEEDFRAMIKQFAREYIANNPDSVAARISREHEERLKQLQELDNHPQL